MSIRNATCVFTLAASALLASFALAQKPAVRITAPIEDSVRTTIAGSKSPRAAFLKDSGPLAPETRLNGMAISFKRSPQQEADAKALIQAQQDPKSPLFHKWLNPEQYAARFGVADKDIAAVQSWLERQGFELLNVSRSRNRIFFSGNAGQLAQTFGSALHNYTDGTTTHFAPSADLTIPSALSGVVMGVENISSFRPKPMHLPSKKQYTLDSSNGEVYLLTPGDVDIIYDVNGAYNAGYKGTGQTIAIAGQSAVNLQDISNFQTAAGLTQNLPTTFLVPNSGSAVTVSGDETESDLDLEYSGGIGIGASVIFVFSGNNPNYGVFDAVQEAVDDDIAPIVSLSYGVCEPLLDATDYQAEEALASQGAMQGQTLIASAGDQGSTSCYPFTEEGLSLAQREELAVNYPASSAYVTGVGGTEFLPANTAYYVGDTLHEGSNAGQYWSLSNSSTNPVSSALSYIPEQTWNDDVDESQVSAGGGGFSIYTDRPAWQSSSVPGMPSGTMRVVPDISLSSSNNESPYLFCTSDASQTDPKGNLLGTCVNGFANADGYFAAAGGTSFAAPIFAGMVSIINQAVNTTGSGLVNTTLYSLASNSSTYASVFHDILPSGTDVTVSGNQCDYNNANYCSSAGASAYAATVGYDPATGLGSFDLYALLQKFPAATNLAPSLTTLVGSVGNPLPSASDTITIKVAAQTTNTNTPTGTVNLAIDGGTAIPITLNGGAATYTFSSATDGSHVIVATYAGDANFAPSTASLVVTVTTPVTGTFSLAVANTSVTAGDSVNTNATVTPANGYTGTVNWTLNSTTDIANFCYAIDAATVSSTAAVTVALTLDTNGNDCSSASSSVIKGKAMRRIAGPVKTASSKEPRPSRTLPATLSLAGLLLLGLMTPKARRFRPLLAFALLAVLGMGMTACGGGSSSSSSSTNTPAGTYDLTLTGTDATTSTTTASASFTLTVTN